MFGRIAAGLVHDLSHPIQNIGNSCKLIQRIFNDAEYRATFAQTVDRELSTVKRLLEDLRNMARPIPLERAPVDLNAALIGFTATSMLKDSGLWYVPRKKRPSSSPNSDVYITPRSGLSFAPHCHVAPSLSQYHQWHQDRDAYAWENGPAES